MFIKPSYRTIYVLYVWYTGITCTHLEKLWALTCWNNDSMCFIKVSKLIARHYTYANIFIFYLLIQSNNTGQRLIANHLSDSELQTLQYIVASTTLAVWLAEWYVFAA